MPKTPSDAALNLLKEFERGPDGTFADRPYLDPAGYLTIGWGHRITSGDRTPTTLTAQMADDLLRHDLRGAADYVNRVVKVEITQSMFDALCCFAFNVGNGKLAGSTLLRVLNDRDYARVSGELLRWNKAMNPKTGLKEPLAGLTRRRAAERDLFLRDGLPG